MTKSRGMDLDDQVKVLLTDSKAFDRETPHCNIGNLSKNRSAHVFSKKQATDYCCEQAVNGGERIALCRLIRSVRADPLCERADIVRLEGSRNDRTNDPFFDGCIEEASGSTTVASKRATKTD